MAVFFCVQEAQKAPVVVRIVWTDLAWAEPHLHTNWAPVFVNSTSVAPSLAKHSTKFIDSSIGVRWIQIYFDVMRYYRLASIY